ncbi:MAG: hypothetical protein V3U98_05140, partial [Acidobacteriota bacterium]
MSPPRAVARTGIVLGLLAALLCPGPALAQRFGKNKITYEDFDWHIYKAPHFDIYYYPEEEAFLEQMISYAESAYLELSQALQHEVRFRIPLIYYKTHREFEQTNIEMAFIPLGVGAFAEPLRKRIVLPIDLPPKDLYALIKHELTHVFEFSILFQDSVGREVRSNPPRWLMEGLASYMAQDEDSFDLMYIRDGVVNGILPKIEQLDRLGFMTYRYGHALFDFITEEFGKEGLRNFLLEFRKVLMGRNIEKAIKEAFGWDVEEFDRRYHKYLRRKYLPALLEKDEPADYGREIAFKSRKHKGRVFQTFSPTISPSGGLVAALTSRYDDLDVVIFSAKDGEVIRNLTKGFTTDYEFISSAGFKDKKDLTWSPDGDRLAFFARKGSGPRLFIFHAISGKKLDEIDIGLAKMASPSFSPDGTQIAFSANEAGVVDIFSLDLRTHGIRNLTQDEFYDSNPSWSADGKQILYNRRLGAYEKLFMVDSSDPTRKTQLTFDNNSDIQPSFSTDGKYVYFASDYGDGGIYNIYSLDLEDGVVRRYTDVVGGNFAPLELNIDTKGRRTVAFVSFFKRRYQIYKMTLGEPLQVFRPGEPPDPPEPRRLGDSREESDEGGESQTQPRSSSGGLDLAPGRPAPELSPGRGFGNETLPGAGGDPSGPRTGGGLFTPAAGGFRVPFLSRARQALNPELAAAARSPLAIEQAEPVQPPEAETFEPPLKLKVDESEKSRYSKKKWGIEGQPQVLFGVADDGTFLSNSLIVFSDLLGDYRQFLRLRSVSSFTDFDYIFLSLKRRANWFVHAFDSRDFFIVGSSTSGRDRRQLRRTTGAEFSWEYPFSLYRRVNLAAGFFDRSQDIPILRQTSGGLFVVDFVRSDEQFPRLSGSFTGDTVRFRRFGPYHGRRYQFSVQWAPTVSGTSSAFIDGGEAREAESFFNYFIDFRNYWSWSRRSLLALRLRSAVSNGNNTDIFAFGGFNTLRGFNFREFFGTRTAYMNLEIRFPLVDELRFPFGSIRQIRGMIFLDVGAAWFSGGEACDMSIDPDPTDGVNTNAECGFFAGLPINAGDSSFESRRVFDVELDDFRRFDCWDSKEGRLRDCRASFGVGLNFFFGPFELNWVFSQILP